MQICWKVSEEVAVITKFIHEISQKAIKQSGSKFM